MSNYMKFSLQALAGITFAVIAAGQPTILNAGSDIFKLGDSFRDCKQCPEMVVIPAGSFLMGDTSGGGGTPESVIHPVTIPKAFAVGKYEVTNFEWQEIVRLKPTFNKGDDYPVVEISWTEAQLFLNRLSAKTGQHYRLLSEAEWEYAARAGTTSAYWWGNDFEEIKANNGTRSLPVGQYGANAFGLHDMHGNVSEWVEDCWNGSYVGSPSNGTARTTGNCTYRIVRGGSLGSLPGHLRSDDRIRARSYPHYGFSNVGLRIARAL